MLKLVVAAALGFLIINLPNLTFPQKTLAYSQRSFAYSDVLGISTGPKEASAESSANITLEAAQPIHTTSRFETKTETLAEKIPRTTVNKDDPDREIDDDAVTQEGKDGTKTKFYTVFYYEGEEYSRELTKVTVDPPEDKIISKGTKIVWRTLATPDGEIRYWRKLHVYATHYDSHCPGCNEWTAIGMHQGKGVIAVDPSVIKMRSQIYIPGYGKAVAGDTGGSIKGKIIDLGFDDARTAGWYAHYIDIYLL